MASRYKAHHPRIQQAARSFSDWYRFKGDVRPLFGDMVHAWTLSLRNAFMPRDGDWDAREAEFAAWRERTGPEGVRMAEECLGDLMMACMDEPGDHLGEMFQQIEANSKGIGQFFTPYQVSSFMARMTMGTDMLSDLIATKGRIEAMEPSCGAGGMVVAMGEAVKAAGHDPSIHLRVTAIDIDRIAVDMTFVQSSLNGIPCFVRCANALDPDAVSGYEFPNVHWVVQGAAAPAG
jgi:hypothetical protein